MTFRQLPVKSGGWQIFLSTVRVFSSGIVTGDDDHKELVEELDEGGSVHSCWGGWTVISLGAAGMMSCSCGKRVDS